MPDDRPHHFTSDPNHWSILKPLAREMRHEPTTTESILWEHLRNRQLAGAKFRLQHAISGFIVDFVCIPQGLIIEVDGAVHDHPDQQAYDRDRQTILEASGFRVLRFPAADVRDQIDRVVETIRAALEET